MTQQITGTVLDLIGGITGADLTGTRPDTLIDDLDLDSLVLVELSVVLKQRLDVAISHDELADCGTVDEIATLVGSRAGATA
ncbi:MAG TPA: phosphopantetheine-binding protein [Actinoplanes sp.]|nr:phosphopantetheine-binding protein [Actinoplanes sp.]